MTYDDAPIGLLEDAGDAARFACDVARMQAQIGRVTWVIVLAEVEEVHRFETRPALSNARQTTKAGGLVRARPTQWDGVPDL